MDWLQLAGIGIWAANIVLLVSMMRRWKRMMDKECIEPRHLLSRLFWKVI